MVTSNLVFLVWNCPDVVSCVRLDYLYFAAAFAMLATLSSPCSSLAMDYATAAAADSGSIFFQTSSAFGDLLALSDSLLLLDIFSLGPPQLRTGLGFLFFFKVSFEKHPNLHRLSQHYAFCMHYNLPNANPLRLLNSTA